MIFASTKKVVKRHVGRNMQKVRMYFEIKQEVLAANLGVSQQIVSKLEQEEEIEDNLLAKIAGVLGVSPDIIKEFDEERTLNKSAYNAIHLGLIAPQLTLHIGKKIEQVRRLRGMTQTEFGNALGITKQAVSKLEKKEKVKDEKLKHIAEALGVTEKILKNFKIESAPNCIYNFYENKSITTTLIGALDYKLNYFCSF